MPGTPSTDTACTLPPRPHSRWVCALAMADAQEELARKLDRLAANPDPKALGALGALSEELQRDWAELQGGAERLRQQVPSPH